MRVSNGYSSTLPDDRENNESDNLTGLKVEQIPNERLKLTEEALQEISREQSRKAKRHGRFVFFPMSGPNG